MILQARELMCATQMTRGPLHQQTARIPAVTNQALAEDEAVKGSVGAVVVKDSVGAV